MKKSPWKKISSKTVAKNQRWEYRKDIFLHNKKEMTYHYIHKKGGAAIVVPVTEDGRVVVIRQPRYVPQDTFFEFPGGGINPGQTPAQAARAEVKEETGYTVKKLVSLGRVSSWAGVTDEIAHLFLAYVGPQGATEREPLEVHIEVLRKTPAQVDALIQKELWDSSSVAAWCRAWRLLK